MKQSCVDHLIDKLHQSGGLAVWSVIITTFGDAIAPRGGVIALSSLQSVMDAIGMEANAVRTALSRLARDGWVERNRIGRQSYYSLSAERLAVFKDATKRIYATGPQAWTGNFEIVLTGEADRPARIATRVNMRDSGYGEFSPGVFVRPLRPGSGQSAVSGNAIVFRSCEMAGMSVPEFVAKCWPVRETARHYERIITLFSPVAEAMAGNPDWSPVQMLAIRILLVHEWRKLVLRDVDLPADCKPGGEVETRARTLVAGLYRMLVKPSEAWLDECLAGPGQTLPPPNAAFHSRFEL